MRIKLDENVSASAKSLLAAAGHQVDTVTEEGLTGAADGQLLTECAHEARLLVTFDVGFGDVRMYPPGTHNGILVLRIRDQQPTATLDVLRRLLDKHDLTEFAGTLVIVTDENVRIRRP